MKLTSIKDFREGNRVNGFYFCVEKRIRLAKTGRPYMHLELRDRSGIVTGRIWNQVEIFDPLIAAGTPVALTAFVERFQDELQLRIIKISGADKKMISEHGYDFEKIVPVSKIPPAYLRAQANQMINLIGSARIRALVKAVFSRFEHELISAPGSSRLHHSYHSGLLEHIVSMAKAGRVISSIYKMDGDLLMAGIFLHDIGKLIEIRGSYSYDYGNRGHMIGHLVLGRDMVRREAEKIKGFEKKVLLKLEHMILSHHGSYEWQSPRRPCFPEALLLHLLDHMDAQMNLMFEALEQDRSDKEWTGNRNYFRMALFKGFNDAD